MSSRYNIVLADNEPSAEVLVVHDKRHLMGMVLDISLLAAHDLAIVRPGVLDELLPGGKVRYIK